MKGRQQGRPIKWVNASVNAVVSIGKAGVTFEVYNKWGKKRKKFGTLTVSVGGLRWWRRKGKKEAQYSWDTVAEWFETR